MAAATCFCSPICSISSSAPTPSSQSEDSFSNLKRLQIRNTRLHKIERHLDEVILDSARLRRGENLLPVERILRRSDSHLLLRVVVPALAMHRDKAPRILVEIFRGIDSLRNRRNLKLKFHQLRIEQLEQHVIHT